MLRNEHNLATEKYSIFQRVQSLVYWKLWQKVELVHLIEMHDPQGSVILLDEDSQTMCFDSGRFYDKETA